MATFAQLSPSTRQPFASLDGSRLRNLTNTKNLQNSLPAMLSSSLKRRHSPSSGDDSNSENVDPSILCSPTKKTKNFDGVAVKASKPSQYVLTDKPPSAKTFEPSIASVRLDTPRAPVGQKRQTAKPLSAPAAPGRSPKHKRIGILSRRRTSSSPFARVDPPAFGSNASYSSGGLSIDAALSGTVSSYCPKPKSKLEVALLEETLPQGWMFDIHEDTPEEEMGNLMEHSTCTLDLSSDDESRQAEKDDRGKENIPPLEYMRDPTTTATRPIPRNDMMSDDSRSPLGNLNAKDYYAEGCDASSFIIITPEKDKVNVSTESATDKKVDSHARPHGNAMTGPQDGWKDFLAQVEESKKSAANIVGEDTANQPADIEIWESESAKGDDNAPSGNQPEVFVQPLTVSKSPDSDCASLESSF